VPTVRRRAVWSAAAEPALAGSAAADHTARRRTVGTPDWCNDRFFLRQSPQVSVRGTAAESRRQATWLSRATIGAAGVRRRHAAPPV